MPTAQIRTLVDRMKKVSHLVTVEITARGDLSFRVHTDALQFETTFSNLVIEEPGTWHIMYPSLRFTPISNISGINSLIAWAETTDATPSEPVDVAEVQVDLRDLTQCLPPSQIQMQRAILGTIALGGTPKTKLVGRSCCLFWSALNSSVRPGLKANHCLLLYIFLHNENNVVYAMLPAKA